MGMILVKTGLKMLDSDKHSSLFVLSNGEGKCFTTFAADKTTAHLEIGGRKRLWGYLFLH